MIRDVWPLVSAAQMQALDRHTIVTLGVPGEVLMESAGRAVAQAALGLRLPGDPVLVVCGLGHNGGDGLVAARHLHMWGVPVEAALVGDPAALKGDPAAQLARARACGVPVTDMPGVPARSGVVIDALFGTGLTREVSGAPLEAIRWMAARAPACRLLAVDLPSGLDADTGQPLGEAVQADVTVTFGLPKLGLALEPGRSLAGKVLVARIGIADTAPGLEVQAELWTRAAAGALLPARPAAGHKGSFGHVLVVAGSLGKGGAGALAAEAALRTGAGLVTLACPASIQPVVAARRAEVMTVPLAETPDGSLSTAALEELLALARERDAVALGPGLGTHPETVALVRSLAARLEAPLVIDADGLNALCGAQDILERRTSPAVLTPHPGEAGRLLEKSPAALNRDRVAAARALSAQTRCIALLKGAASVVAHPAGRIAVNPTGGPILATGGTGDVLTGMVAGLLAQRLSPFDAAALAAFLHGAAADRLAERAGSSGSLAAEVAAEIPAAAQALRQSAALRAHGTGHDADGLSLAFPEP